MIKIRYRDPRELAPGLYAAAECHSRGTTVYLLPGLSAAQRRAALRRLRISARRGCGPQLPAPQLAVALLADRIRTAAGRAGAVFRSHPAASTVPVMVVSAGAIAFLALSGVSIRVIQPPPGSSQPSFAAGVPRPVSRRARGRRETARDTRNWRTRVRPGPAAAGRRAGRFRVFPGASGTAWNGPARAGRSGQRRPMRAGTARNEHRREPGRPATATDASGGTAAGPIRTRAPAGIRRRNDPAPGAPTRPPRRRATASSSAPAACRAPFRARGGVQLTGPGP